MKKLLYILAAACALSCSKTIPGEPVEQPAEEPATVRFNIDIPRDIPGSGSGNTRAVGENTILNMDLLVFNENGQYIERLRAENLVCNETTRRCSFSVRLPISANQRTIHLLANQRKQSDDSDRIHNFPPYGTQESVVMAALVTKRVGSPVSVDDFLPLIMWGKITLPSVSASQTVSGVKLLRTAAMLEVVVPSSSEYPHTVENGLAIFNLQWFSVMRSTVVGVVPPANWATWNNASPGGNTFSGDNIATDDHFSSLPFGGYWSTPTQPHYIYEQRQDSENKLYIILMANYMDGPSPYPVFYYKLHVKDENGNPLQIERNHRYVIKIRKVTGRGYATLQQAVDGPPSDDIVVQMTDVRPNDEITSIVSNGSNYLGVSNTKVTIVGFNGSTDRRLEVALTTAFTGLSFETPHISYSPTSGSNSPLTSVTITQPDSNGVCRIMAYAIKAGTGKIILTHGNLRQEIDVEVTSLNGYGLVGTNGYYMMPLMDVSNVPWTAELTGAGIGTAELRQNVFLHTSPSAYLNIPLPQQSSLWGAYEISSGDPYVQVYGTPTIAPYPDELYYYFWNGTMTATSRPVGTIKYSRKEGNGIVVGRLIFNG